MNKFTRRTFLTQLLFTHLAIGGFIPKSHASTEIDLKNLYSASSLKKEMLKAYANWSKKFNQKPAEYTNDLKRNSMTEKLLSRRSTEEFKNGETIDFNGVLLGKTEAAIILNSYFN